MHAFDFNLECVLSIITTPIRVFIDGENHTTQTGKELAKLLDIPEADGDLLFNAASGLTSAKGGINLTNKLASSANKLTQKEIEQIKNGLAANQAKNDSLAGQGTSAKISPENQKYVDILSPETKQHILYGDGPTSGGHMYPGNPGKSTFPKDWSADKIVHEIGDIATSPNTQWYAQSGTGGLYTKAGNPARWAAYEIRDGVRIRVIYEPANGKIITAFPDKAPVPSHYKPIK